MTADVTHWAHFHLGPQSKTTENPPEVDCPTCLELLEVAR